MSTIARAFTTRKVKMSIELANEAKARGDLGRSNTTRAPEAKPAPRRAPSTSGSTYRPKISAPLELVHTTNMLSYNAPDIFPKSASASSSAASTKSDNDSSSLSSPVTAASSPPTSPDVSNASDRCVLPEANHLSCYFKGTGIAMPPASALPPAIPQRAPSHTKKASFEALTRQRSNSGLSNQSMRSISTKGSYTFSRTPSTSTNASTVPPSPCPAQVPKMPPPMAPVHHATRIPYEPMLEDPRENHPFGNELAKVSEIAEEFGISGKLQVIDEEEQELVMRGLCKFSADVYLREIQTLATTFFRESIHNRPAAAVWI